MKRPAFIDNKKAGIWLLALSILLMTILFIQLFRYLPIENTTLGLDWKDIWKAIRQGQITYDHTGNKIGGIYTPPWGLLLLMPLGYLPFRESWAIVSLISIMILIFSVPRLPNNQIYWLGCILLTISFPAMRNLADGNLEAFVIGGIALAAAGFKLSNIYLLSFGLLLASIKIQEAWLLLLAFSFWMVTKKPRRQSILVFSITGLVVCISLVFWGKDWLSALFISGDSSQLLPLSLTATMGRGSLIDISLAATLSRLGFAPWFSGLAWILIFCATIFIFLIWEKSSQPPDYRILSLLVCDSVLLSPYTSGNSALTILAVGIIPLIQAKPFLGLPLFVLPNLLYFVPHEILFEYQSNFWTAFLIVFLGIISLQIIPRHNPA